MGKRARVLLASLPLMACQPAPLSGPTELAVGAPPQACATELVTMKPGRGVIFGNVCSSDMARSIQYAADAEVAGYFSPTAAMITTLESRLRPALELGREKPETLYRLSTNAEDRAEESWGVRGALAEILQRFEFRRQYVGIVVGGGARRILVNCFPEVEPGKQDEFADWTRSWQDSVDDGGAEFWRIQYDLTMGQFLGFNINPSG
jgi:hypothetical protein